MGGLGSGGQNSKGRRIVEAQYWLDASHLNRRGVYREGFSSPFRWTRDDGAEAASIRIHGGADMIRLKYRWQRGDGQWQVQEEHVSLTRVPRHLGGEETYFCCPRCAARVKRLYGGDVRFLCRTCLGLVHASTQERPGNRATRRNRKLRRRLGVGTGIGDWIGPKPKGMHQKTFEKISARIHAAEADVYDDMLILMNRLKRTTERRSARIGGGERSKDFWR